MRSIFANCKRYALLAEAQPEAGVQRLRAKRLRDTEPIIIGVLEARCAYVTCFGALGLGAPPEIFVFLAPGSLQESIEASLQESIEASLQESIEASLMK